MTMVNEQEIKRRLNIFADVELARASEDFIQKSAECPPLSHVPSAAIHGWPPSTRDHVSGGCLQCRKMIALQWNISPPPLGSIVRHLVDGTLPEERQILHYVEDAGQASRIVTIIRILTPVLQQLRKIAHFIASAHPALTVATGAVFAPASEEMNELTGINYVHSGFRWTAPIEAGKQYVYVEAANPASVAIIIGSSSETPTHTEPRLERVELVSLELRGTQFTWRAASSLGEVAELTKSFGKDYEVVVVVLSDDEYHDESHIGS
jgi:hypothetical protein